MKRNPTIAPAPIRVLQHGEAIDIVDSNASDSAKLYVLQNSLGIVGIVRADSWEDAWEVAEDELFPEADESTWAGVAKECGFEGDEEELMNDAVFQENYGFRPNGPNVHDQFKMGLYQKDLNGESLDLLTDALATRLGLVIELA
jgi:hypothetical protein